MNARPPSSEAPAPPADRASSPRVLVIVLSWNGREQTLACLDSVLAQRHAAYDVLVVDNASTDGSPAAIRERFGDRVRLHRNDANLLYAGGMNVGLEEALRAPYEYALLLNNDVRLDPEMLQHLVAAAEADPVVAACGPKIYYEGSDKRLWFAGGELSLWRGWSRHRGIREVDCGQYDRAADVDYLTGAALLMRLDAVRRVGLLDPGYRMYAEDADWCFRARRAGYRLRYVPQARMWHAVSSSSGTRSAFKIRRRLRSQLRFWRRHARPYHYLTIPFGTILEAGRVAWAVARGRV